MGSWRLAGSRPSKRHNRSDRYPGSDESSYSEHNRPNPALLCRRDRDPSWLRGGDSAGIRSFRSGGANWLLGWVQRLRLRRLG